jgi:DNA-binding CsgD family transcriptional regulator
MSASTSTKIGNVAAMVRLLRSTDAAALPAASSAPAEPSSVASSQAQPSPVFGGAGPVRSAESRTHPTPANLRKRQMLAELCRLIGAQVGAGGLTRQLSEDPSLSPRLRQTLERLLAGDSEKQIAAHLRLSHNTIHVYVKALHRHYNVSSRGELLAHFVKRSHGL